jgi:methyl-accepting chemotaxis protein
MHLVSRLKLRAKLALLLALSVAAMVAIGVVGATTLHRRMLDDRLEKSRATVHAAVSLAAGLEARVEAHELTHAQAFDAFHRDVAALRYDHGNGYMSVIDGTSGLVLMHATRPALEGKRSPLDVGSGRLLSDLVLESVRSSDEGVTSYMFPKPGQTTPLR